MASWVSITKGQLQAYCWFGARRGLFPGLPTRCPKSSGTPPLQVVFYIAGSQGGGPTHGLLALATLALILLSTHRQKELRSWARLEDWRNRRFLQPAAHFFEAATFPPQAFVEVTSPIYDTFLPHSITLRAPVFLSSPNFHFCWSCRSVAPRS